VTCPVFCLFLPINKAKKINILIINTKTMETTEHNPNCIHCQKRKENEAQAEEMNLAILIAFVPLLVMTLFGQMGLI
jgi:hypothetical protein